MLTKKTKERELQDTESWTVKPSKKMKKKLDPYKREGKHKFRFQEAYEELDDTLDNTMDINIDDDSTMGIALDKIKSRLDSDVGFPQVVRFVPSKGRGRTFDPKFVAKMEGLEGGMYKIHDIDRKLIKDYSTEKELRDANTFKWDGAKRILSKLLAQVLAMRSVKVDDIKVGDYVDQNGERKRVDSISNTAGNSYFIRFDDMESTYIDKGEEMNVVKAS